MKVIQRCDCRRFCPFLNPNRTSVRLGMGVTVGEDKKLGIGVHEHGGEPYIETDEA